VIHWMMDDEKGLLIGTVGGEWVARANNSTEVITPSNLQAKRSSTNGGANLQAVRAGRASLFIQRAGQKLLEMAYVFEDDGFASPDMTVFSEHILRGGTVDISFQQEPQPTIWMVREDGTLVGVLYSREQDIIGWHRQLIGGDGIVESIAAIPSTDESRDELWMVVKRTIGGLTKRYIEYMTPLFDDATDQADAFFVDSGLSYSGPPATTFSGLEHLEGETLSILADGATHPDDTVVDGSITLDRSASKVHIGYSYNSDIFTLRPEAGSQDGVSQGKTKRIHRVTLRLNNSLGGELGEDEDSLNLLVFRTTTDPMDTVPPLFTGDVTMEWDAEYNTEARMFIRQSQPLPFTLLAIMPQLRTYDR